MHMYIHSRTFHAHVHSGTFYSLHVKQEQKNYYYEEIYIPPYNNAH